MSVNYNAILIFPIYDQFEAIRKLDSKRMVYNSYVFTNSNLLSNKNWKQS